MLAPLAVLLLAIAASAQAVPPTVATAPTATAVRQDGLVATWYPPASGRRGPAIIVLGGSEGGEAGGKRLAAPLVAQGYGVLALAYFKADGLPQTLQNIPLDYFDRAIAWLVRQPLVDPKRLGILGVSIGGETALIVAARHPEMKAVVAAVPSSVVWQGYDPADYRSVESTFAIDGKGVPYLPYDTVAPFTGVFDLYANSLKAIGRHPQAVIPVERIGGAILLLSAKGDTLWPSSLMADQVIARLDANGFKPRHDHIAYPDAGHAAVVPAADPAPIAGGTGGARDDAYDNLGGTQAGNRAARADSWRRIPAFFAETLGAPALARQDVTR